MLKILLWVGLLVNTVLGILGLNIVIIKGGWLVGMPLLVLFSFISTFLIFSIVYCGERWDFTSGRFDNE